MPTASETASPPAATRGRPRWRHLPVCSTKTLGTRLGCMETLVFRLWLSERQQLYNYNYKVRF